MSFALLRLSPSSLIPVVLSLLVFGACASDEPPSGAARGDSAAGAASSAGDETREPGSDEPAGTAEASDERDAGDTTAPSTPVSDSIGFPAGKPLGSGQRYNVRSGIIELRSSFMGDVRQTIYFDDYGKKEAVHANANVGGKTTRSVMVMSGGSNVVYDPDRKAGTRIDLADALSQLGLGGIPNLSSLDANAKRELKYKPIEGRTVLGKPTQGASIEVVGTPLKVWSWQGIPLRMEASTQGNQMVVEATSLKLDVAVPPERFVVPKDIKITDFKTGE